VPEGAPVAAMLARGQMLTMGGGPGSGSSGSGADSGGGRGGRPPLIPTREAAYLRVKESFPELPPSLRVAGRTYAAVLEICVSPDGKVNGVNLAERGAPELDRAFAGAARTWRYRPRLIDGAPVPFCHLIRAEYRYG
jgi:TonB family protein